MTDKNSAIIEKIKKLFAMANANGTTEAEASMFSDKVQELLAEYNLDISVIHEGEEVAKVNETILDMSSYGHIKWRRSLFGTICRMYFCKGVISERSVYNKNGNPTVKSKFRFIGKEHNRAVAISMYQYLEQTIVRLSKDFSKVTNERYHFEQGAGLRLSSRIHQKTEEMMRKPVVANTGNLPALFSTELALVDDYLSGEKLRAGRVHANNMNDASMAGWKAGNGISLNDQIGSSSSNKFLLK